MPHTYLSHALRMGIGGNTIPWCVSNRAKCKAAVQKVGEILPARVTWGISHDEITGTTGGHGRKQSSPPVSSKW